MDRTTRKRLEAHFAYEHENPRDPFNPLYDPMVSVISDAVREEMEHDGYYDTHSREECAAERKARIDVRMSRAKAEFAAIAADNKGETPNQ